jgi:hypothetical protein
MQADHPWVPHATRRTIAVSAGALTPWLANAPLAADRSTQFIGPIYHVLEGMPDKVIVEAVSGKTSTVTPTGSRYINLLPSGIAAGATVTLHMRFTTKSASDVSYSARVLAGPGKR